MLPPELYPTDDQPRRRLLTVAEARALPPMAPLIEGVLDLDSMAMLYGRRGSYKSFMALDWALCVANGTRWHSRPTTQGTVVYLVGEGLNGFVQRIDAWRAHHPMQGETNLLLYPEAVNLLSPSSVGPFADECARVGASLVVIDTLSRCFVGGEENGGKDGSIGVEQLDVIRKRTGACVLLVHHAGKDAERGSRGWSGWEAAADDVWQLESKLGDVTLRCTKRKSHPEPRDAFFTATPAANSIVLTEGGPTDRLPGALLETLRTLVGIDAGNGVPTGQWQLSSDVAERTFYRYRSDLVRLGLVHNVGSEKRPRYQATEQGTATTAKEVPR